MPQESVEHRCIRLYSAKDGRNTALKTVVNDVVFRRKRHDGIRP
jgi:hypothetical protein